MRCRTLGVRQSRNRQVEEKGGGAGREKRRRAYKNNGREKCPDSGEEPVPHKDDQKVLLGEGP